MIHDRQVANIRNPTRRSTRPAPPRLWRFRRGRKVPTIHRVCGSSKESREEQAVTPNEALSRTNLKTPKAAAIAGMLFSLLTVAAFWLLWISVPADPQFEHCCARFESRPICRDCLPVVHRRPARPPRPAGRPVFCDRVFRKRPLVPRHAIHRSGDRRCNPHGVRRAAGRADQLRYIPLRARGRLQYLEYIHDQDRQAYS
jgi:hypothetical protein